MITKFKLFLTSSVTEMNIKNLFDQVLFDSYSRGDFTKILLNQKQGKHINASSAHQNLGKNSNSSSKSLNIFPKLSNTPTPMPPSSHPACPSAVAVAQPQHSSPGDHHPSTQMTNLTPNSSHSSEPNTPKSSRRNRKIFKSPLDQNINLNDLEIRPRSGSLVNTIFGNFCGLRSENI